MKARPPRHRCREGTTPYSMYVCGELYIWQNPKILLCSLAIARFHTARTQMLVTVGDKEVVVIRTHNIILCVRSGYRKVNYSTVCSPLLYTYSQLALLFKGGQNEKSLNSTESLNITVLK